MALEILAVVLNSWWKVCLAFLDLFGWRLNCLVTCLESLFSTSTISFGISKVIRCTSIKTADEIKTNVFSGLLPFLVIFVSVLSCLVIFFSSCSGGPDVMFFSLVFVSALC